MRAPQHVDDLLDRNRCSGVYREQAEQGALQRGVEGDRRVPPADRERPEHVDAEQPGPLPGRTGRRDQRPAFGVGQGEGVGEPAQRRLARPGAVLLDVAQRPHGQPGAVGGLVLGQPGPQAVPAQQVTGGVGGSRVRWRQPGSSVSDVR